MKWYHNDYSQEALEEMQRENNRYLETGEEGEKGNIQEENTENATGNETIGETEFITQQ